MYMQVSTDRDFFPQENRTVEAVMSTVDLKYLHRQVVVKYKWIAPTTI